MKSALLFALRITNGLLIVIWGMVKVASPEAAIGISDKYYSGALSMAQLQAPLGIAQVCLGLLLIAGLFRSVVYPVQAVVLVLGALAIWPYLLDPLALYIVSEENRQMLFFPSSTVAVASLMTLAFKDEDTIHLDKLLFNR